MLIRIVAASLISLSAFAATKTYQVTGPVTQVTEKTITVQKGKEKWEVARDAATKVNGELKVGSKATISYTMTAADVDVKTAKAPKATKKSR